MTMVYCKGCLTNEYCDDYGNDMVECELIKYNGEGECPCTNCIVKPMCEQVCDDFFAFKIENERVVTGDT